MTQLWLVWSSGVEEWHPIEAPGLGLTWSHAKVWRGKRLDVFVDGLGRYVGKLET